jgi:Arc/MetJ-type ribon-helix-helix transcriptional regulator
MTTTVKLPSPLEDSLRERSVAEGRSISEVMRDALTMYLATPPKGVRSPLELGMQLFGRYHGPANLASERKSLAASVWDEIAAQKQLPQAPGSSSSRS